MAMKGYFGLFWPYVARKGSVMQHNVTLKASGVDPHCLPRDRLSGDLGISRPSPPTPFPYQAPRRYTTHIC